MLSILSIKRFLAYFLYMHMYRVFIFFQRILESLPPLRRQISAAAIGCTKKYQPIEVTVHSHYVLYEL